MFHKYQHIEKLSSPECDGLLFGDCHIFYKIDGTNGSVWGEPCEFGIIVKAGSRNRELSYESDNAGFYAWVQDSVELGAFLIKYPHLRLFGEWLVPHSLKTYADNAWRDFYVFDVVEVETGKYLRYEEYKPLLEEFGINYIPPLAIYKNPSVENLHGLLEKSGQFLVKDGEGFGEGLVIKNYDFVNKFGRTTWAKLITNEFKERHHKEMGAPILNGTEFVEQKIVDEFCTDVFLQKEKAKLELEVGEWNNKLIPRLMGVAYYELIREESWNFIKKHKNPTISYGLLNKLVIIKVRKFLDL